MKRSLSISLLLLLAGTTSLGAQQPKRQVPIVVPFYAEAAQDQAVDVLKNGPVTLFFECRGDFAFLGMRTTVDGTMVSPQSPHMFGASGVDEVAILIGKPEITENGTRSGYAQTTPESGSGASVITPDGTVLTVPCGRARLGDHLYRHPDAPGTPWVNSPGCFVVGTALLLKADLGQ